MRNLLLSTQDQIFIKGLYSPLRDEGFEVDIVEHASESVRYSLHKSYGVVILDSRDVGLNAYEAASIIKHIRPETTLVLLVDTDIMENELIDDIFIIETPVELDYFIKLLKQIINDKFMTEKKGGMYDTKRSHVNSL